MFRCVLTNDESADSDTTQVAVDPSGSDTMYGQAAMSLAAASTLPRAGHWILRGSKSHPNPGGEAHDIKMQAIQLGSLTNSPSP